MPLGLDPEQTADVWLKSDAPKPLATRPTFQFKYLTSRELRQVQELRAQARKEEDNAKCEKLIFSALAIALRGWKNMTSLEGDQLVEIPYAFDRLPEITTLAEQWELLNDFPQNVMNSENDRANFPSPSPSPSANSAPEPVATANPAPTNPPSPNQSTSAGRARRAKAT